MSTEVTTPPDHGPIPSYDRDAIVKSITRYYKLLSKAVSIKPSHIIYPPKEGWDDMEIDKMRRLGFNDRVIDLVHHLPYVTSIDRPVYPGTGTICYFGSVLLEPDEKYQLEDPLNVFLWPLPDERIPEGVVPLSDPLQGDPYATWWILDTNNGELTAHDDTIRRPPEEVPEDAQWRSARPVPATAYFDGLSEKLLSLELIPLPGHSKALVWDMWFSKNIFPGQEKWINEAKDIYRQCHWPTLQYFQRARCRRLLIEMQNRRRDEMHEEYKRRPPPPEYTDVEGNPIEPPPGHVYPDQEGWS